MLAKTEAALNSAGYEAEVAGVAAYRTLLTGWVVDAEMPDGTGLRASLRAVLARIETAEADIRAAQGNRTYAAALSKVNELLALRSRLDDFGRRRAELQRMAGQVDRLLTFIDSE